jgi:hypothetical protein
MPRGIISFFPATSFPIRRIDEEQPLDIRVFHIPLQFRRQFRRELIDKIKSKNFSTERVRFQMTHFGIVYR